MPLRGDATVPLRAEWDSSCLPSAPLQRPDAGVRLGPVRELESRSIPNPRARRNVLAVTAGHPDHIRLSSDVSPAGSDVCLP